MNHALKPHARLLAVPRARVAHRLLALGAFALLAACSAGPADDLALGDDAMSAESGEALEVRDDRPTLDEREAEFQRLAHGELTEEETQRVA
ncbi:MAG TPA: hypothetical protein VMG12_15610, partial [Polyangiaceae bacterium]|nr:hypothetical protein [Polyangiaceae bacterium]